MGLTHLDAGVLIGFLNSEDAHHRSAAKALVDALHAGEMPSETIFGQFERELGIVIEGIACGFDIYQPG